MYRVFLSLFILFIMIGCKTYNNVEKIPSIEGNISDYEPWYDDDSNDVLEVRVTTPTPNDYDCKPYDDLNASPRPCELIDVLNDSNALDDYEPVLHVIFESEGFSSNIANASFKQKGKSTRNAKQKSFRIKLDSKIDLYKNERTYQLNKHPYDKSRMRNRLFFEIFRDIPNFTSLKTRFVNLKVNGEDYGLYTHIEKCDEIYLKNHHFSEDDNLYKGQNFAFMIKEGMELDSKGRPLDPDAFDESLQIESGKDQQRLIDMINAINAETTDEEFEKVFDRYFDRDNYLTWFAVNIIVANKDTTTQNFFLLNPKYSDKFYFLPWDYDGASRDTYKYAKWELGIGNWWIVPLHRKFLSIKKNRDDLDKMVYFIRDNYITDEIMKEKMDSFRTIVEPYIQSLPDSEYLSYARWETEFYKLRDERMAEDIKNYEEQKGLPMPFWQFISYDGKTLDISWTESIDLEGDKIIYKIDFTKADDVNFTNTMITEDNITKEDSRITVSQWGLFSYKRDINLDPGTYFMKIVAYEDNNRSSYQITFNKEVRVNRVHLFGVSELNVE